LALFLFYHNSFGQILDRFFKI